MVRQEEGQRRHNANGAAGRMDCAHGAPPGAAGRIFSEHGAAGSAGIRESSHRGRSHWERCRPLSVAAVVAGRRRGPWPAALDGVVTSPGPRHSLPSSAAAPPCLRVTSTASRNIDRDYEGRRWGAMCCAGPAVGRAHGGGGHRRVDGGHDEESADVWRRAHMCGGGGAETADSIGEAGAEDRQDVVGVLGRVGEGAEASKAPPGRRREEGQRLHNAQGAAGRMDRAHGAVGRRDWQVGAN